MFQSVSTLIVICYCSGCFFFFFYYLLFFFFFVCVFLLFFQAEDGIRDLVRSRGLGDVYKRQAGRFSGPWGSPPLRVPGPVIRLRVRAAAARAAVLSTAVSYTHLTLPTSDLV